MYYRMCNCMYITMSMSTCMYLCVLVAFMTLLNANIFIYTYTYTYAYKYSSGPQRGGQGGQIAPGPRTPRSLRL